MHTHLVFYLGSQFLAAAGKLNVISFSFLFVLSTVHWRRPWVTVPTDCHNPYHAGRQEAIAQRKPGCLLSSTEDFTWNYALFTWNSCCPLLTSWRWYPASCPQQSIWESSSGGGGWCGGRVGPLRGVPAERGIPGEEMRAFPCEGSPPASRAVLPSAPHDCHACCGVEGKARADCVSIPCKAGRVTIGTETQAPGISPLG